MSENRGAIVAKRTLRAIKSIQRRIETGGPCVIGENNFPFHESIRASIPARGEMCSTVTGVIVIRTTTQITEISSLDEKPQRTSMRIQEDMSRWPASHEPKD